MSPTFRNSFSPKIFRIGFCRLEMNRNPWMYMQHMFFFPKASSMLGFSFRRLREERERMSGSGGRAVDGLWTGGSCRNSMGGG